MSPFSPFSEPNPSGSPLEKIKIARRTPSPRDFITYLQREGVDPDLAQRLGRAVQQWEFEMHFDEIEHLIDMEMWANTHTHPGSGGGGGGISPDPETEFGLVYAASTTGSGVTSLSIPTHDDVRVDDIVYLCWSNWDDSLGSISPGIPAGWTNLTGASGNSEGGFAVGVMEHKNTGGSEGTDWTLSWTGACEASLVAVVVRGTLPAEGFFGDRFTSMAGNRVNGLVNQIDMVDFTPTSDAIMFWFSVRTADNGLVESHPDDLLALIENPNLAKTGIAFSRYPGILAADSLVAPGIIQFPSAVTENRIHNIVIAGLSSA